MEKKIKTRKQRKGITLIALVITIVVLLILAGITINLTVGQDGIITRAQEAGVEHEKAQLKEELELAILDIRTEKLSQGKSMTREDLKGLEKIGATMSSLGTPAEGEYKDYYFEVDENYEVTIIGKLKGEKPSVQAEVITTGIVEQGGKVEIKVTASISEGNITEIVAGNGAVLKTDTSIAEKVFEVGANGTYTFTAKADNGRSAQAVVEVNTIIEKPVIEIKDITKTSFKIVVNNNYKEGLITEYKYYVGGTLKSEANTTAKEFAVTGLTAETQYSNIYVEAYIGEKKLTSEVTSATTKTEGLEYSWEELEKVAEAISNKDETKTISNKAETITRDTANVSIVVDGKTYELAVGDIAKVSVDGVSKTVRIMGFNHDTLSDTAAYGEGKENTYAGISFEFVNFITSAGMNSTNTNSGGWASSALRGTLNNTTINTLSNKEQIKEVKKSYIATYNSASSVTTSNDKLWLLSCSETWNNARNSSAAYGYAIAKEGEQYKYYKDINADSGSNNKSLVKDSDYWWLRSPYYDGSSNFCGVTASGSCNYRGASTSHGVAPGFSI